MAVIKFTVSVGSGNYDEVVTKSFKIETDDDANDQYGLSCAIDTARCMARPAIDRLVGDLVDVKPEKAIEEKEESKAISDANSKRWTAENKQKKAEQAAADMKEQATCLVNTLRSNGLSVPTELLAKMGIDEAPKTADNEEEMPF